MCIVWSGENVRMAKVSFYCGLVTVKDDKVLQFRFSIPPIIAAVIGGECTYRRATLPAYLARKECHVALIIIALIEVNLHEVCSIRNMGILISVFHNM